MTLMRFSVVGILLGTMLGLGLTAAHAIVYSANNNFVTYNVSYRNQASGQDGQYAGTGLTRTTSGTSPVGWMGVQARVFFSNGSLCNSSIMAYNTFATSYTYRGFIHNCGGPIYSHGKTETWRGTDYRTVNTEQTPVWYG